MPSGWTKGDLPRGFKLKDGRWRAEKRLPRLGADGKVLRDPKSGKALYTRINATRNTRGAAEKALIERLEAIKSGDDAPRKKPKDTKAETIDSWLREYLHEISIGDGAIRETTSTMYGHLITGILRPEYGLTGIALKDLDSEVIKQWRQKIATLPTERTGAPMAAGRLKQFEFFLNGALNTAVAHNKITANPFPPKTTDDKRRAKLSKKQESKRKKERSERERIEERIYWMPQRLYQKLLADHQTQQSDWTSTRLLMYLLSMYGVRPHEVRGLTLDRVKLTPGKECIHIAQTLVGTKVEPYVKTEASERTLPLTEPLLSVIKEQVKRRKKAAGAGKGTLLLAGKKGGVVRQQDHNKDYNDLIKKELGWNYIRLYANRHIATTALQMFKCDPIVLHNIMGWESPLSETMLEVYGHFTDELKMKQALTELGNFITQPPNQKELPRLAASADSAGQTTD